MVRIIFVGMLLLAYSLAIAQTSPMELWRTAEYVESINLKGPRIEVDKCQNIYMITNQTDANFFGGFTLVKYDSLGQPFWNRNYSQGIIGHFYGDFTLDSLGHSYVSLQFDGGLPSYDADAILLKYAPNGDKLWEANYSANQTGDELIHHTGLTPAGRLIILGRNAGSDTSHVNDFLFVSAIDTATGEELWRTKIAGIFRPQDLYIHPDRIQLLASQSRTDGRYYIILQVDFNGTIIEENAKPYSTYGFSGNHISKNGDILFCNSYFGHDVTRVNMLGDTLWHYHYPDIYGSGTNWVRYLDEDDSLYVSATGIIESPGLSVEMLTTKLSPTGEIVWQNIYHTINDSLGDAGEYLVFNDSIFVVAGATQLANRDVVGLINVYKNVNGEELYNIFLGYDNIFTIDQVKLVGNKIYYTGEGFNGSLNEMKVITGCIKLPMFISSSNAVLSSDVKIFPNPAADYISITNLDQSVFTYLEVRDVKGSMITSSKIEQSTINVDISGYQPGMYMLTLKGKKISLTKKIIKAR